MKVGYEEVIIITAVATVTFKLVSTLYDYVIGVLSSKRH